MTNKCSEVKIYELLDKVMNMFYCVFFIFTKKSCICILCKMLSCTPLELFVLPLNHHKNGNSAGVWCQKRVDVTSSVQIPSQEAAFRAATVLQDAEVTSSAMFTTPRSPPCSRRWSWRKYSDPSLHWKHHYEYSEQEMCPVQLYYVIIITDAFMSLSCVLYVNS